MEESETSHFFSRMRSEGFPFIVGGLGVGPLFAASWSARRFRVVNSVSIGEAAKPRVFCDVDVAVSIGEAAKPRVFCCVDVAVSIGEAAKPRVFCYVDVAVSIGEAATPL